LDLKRIVTIVVTTGGIGLGSLGGLVGCGDNSKTTGTMVDRDEKEKAALDSMRASMKSGRAEQKQQDAEAVKAKKAP